MGILPVVFLITSACLGVRARQQPCLMCRVTSLREIKFAFKNEQSWHPYLKGRGANFDIHASHIPKLAVGIEDTSGVL
ncbi:hypothetical protein GGR56DRAFT_616724, partial [Xylariaceae sp. FL0804]